MAVAFSRWNLERHATKTLRARRKVNEIVVGFVHPTCNTINPLACVAICLCAQINRNKFSSRTLKCFTPEDSREKVPMPFGNLMHALQNVRAVFFVPMLEAAARQFARRACQHTTVDVKLSRRSGRHLLANRLIAGNDSTCLQLSGTSVQRVSVRQRNLAAHIHAKVWVELSILRYPMRVKAPIPRDSIQPVFKIACEFAHLLRFLAALRTIEHFGQTATPCDHPGIVAEKDSEVSLLQIDDHDVATDQCGLTVAEEVPCIDRETSFQQPKLFRPTVGIAGAVLNGVQRSIQVLLHPGIVARGLPNQVQRLKKVHLHVIFDGRTAQAKESSIRGSRKVAVFESPVPIAFRRRSVDVILPDHSVFALRVRENLKTLLHFRPEIAHASQRVCIVQQPVHPVGIHATIVAARSNRPV